MSSSFELGEPDFTITVLCKGKPSRNGGVAFEHEKRVAKIMRLRHFPSLAKLGASSSWLPSPVTSSSLSKSDPLAAFGKGPLLVEWIREGKRVDILAEMGQQPGTSTAPMKAKLLMRCPAGCFDEQRSLTKIAPVLDRLREANVEVIELYALAAILNSATP